MHAFLFVAVLQITYYTARHGLGGFCVSAGAWSALFLLACSVFWLHEYFEQRAHSRRLK